jgi:hypothetical protein
MAFPYLIQGKNIVVIIDNQPHTVTSTHIGYEKLKQAIKDNDWDTVKQVVDPAKEILEYGNGHVAIQGSKVFYKEREMAGVLTSRLIEMYQDGFPVEPLILFMENLMQNPSKRAVEELYGFLEKGNLPLTPDGYFLAYKKVRTDFLDIHSGTMDNSPGKTVEMERNEVDDDQNRTCSAGLHFCSKEYLPHFGTSSGDRVVILKINPRDVVSIPADYNATKGRTCRYEVIGELGVHPDEAFIAPVQVEAAKDTDTEALIKAAVDAAVKAALTAVKVNGIDHK